jgi:ATP-dependent Clp protease ATP-binding subunit ClpA
MIAENLAPSMAQAAESIRKGILDCFPGCGQAYLSRLDAVVPFIGIDPDASIQLSEMYLDRYIEQKVLPKNLHDQVKANILNRSTPEERKDGRQLQRIVREAIFDELNIYAAQLKASQQRSSPDSEFNTSKIPAAQLPPAFNVKSDPLS